MGNPKAFLNVDRLEAGYRPIHERIKDFSEVEQTLNSSGRCLQASRCMDCGVPFCHWACPIDNKQPEWQDMLYKGQWEEAYRKLEETCDFPEFTGRVCPALCEKSCVLNLSCSDPVTIRENEAAIIETAFREGYVKATRAERNGKNVAVIGSGPAGLTVANRLNRKGYEVTVFEKNELPGGLLRFGIPDFKLAKQIVDRRIALMEEEGIVFKMNAHISREITVREIITAFDAVCLAIGSEIPRDLPIEGRELKGIHFALDYLIQQNRIVEGLTVPEEERLRAKDKHVIVIGGGDTGSDCVGTANRQKAKSITQIEILPQPPEGFNPDTPWPLWPQVLRTSSSHEEGCTRRWSLSAKRFIEDGTGHVNALEVEKVEWVKPNDGGNPVMKTTGETEILDADMVLLSMGFINPVQDSIIKELSLNTDERRNIAVNDINATSHEKVFACGDAVSGASLVVHAMASGRKTARDIDRYLCPRPIQE